MIVQFAGLVKLGFPRILLSTIFNTFFNNFLLTAAGGAVILVST
jgi:hypothetical protein